MWWFRFKISLFSLFVATFEVFYHAKTIRAVSRGLRLYGVSHLELRKQYTGKAVRTSQSELIDAISLLTEFIKKHQELSKHWRYCNPFFSSSSSSEIFVVKSYPRVWKQECAGSIGCKNWSLIQHYFAYNHWSYIFALMLVIFHLSFFSFRTEQAIACCNNRQQIFNF